MTFSWRTPPWERFEDCTYLTVILTDAGEGQFGFTAEAVRGDDAIEALSDLLMGSHSLFLLLTASAPAAPIGIVVRRGIDAAWLAQPPIQVAQDERGRWHISVRRAKDEEITVFSPPEVTGIASRLRAQYGDGS